MAVPKKKPDEGPVIELKRLDEGEVRVSVRGLTPLIPHRWSEKSKRMMPGHPENEGRVKSKKGVRKPEEEAEACLYRLEDGTLGMPATAFKSAIIDACRFFDKPTMTEAKLLVYVVGEGPDQLVRINGGLSLREDTPRNANGSADLRYRYQINDWTAELTIRFPMSSITPEAIAALVDAAGRCGVGDWRPSSPKSKTGTYGTWRAE